MNNAELVFNVLKKVRKEIMSTAEKETIYKVYRQTRIWLRYETYMADNLSVEMYQYITRKLKHYRDEAIRKHFNKGGHKNDKTTKRKGNRIYHRT